MRKILIFSLFFIFIGIAILSIGELSRIWKTLQQASFFYILLATLLLFGWVVNEAACYNSLYKLMGIREKFRHLVLLSSATSFINVVAPSGGFGGVAIFVDDAGKKGHPRGMAAATGALFIFLEYAAFMIILGLGWGVLIRRNDLNAGELTASIIMLGIVLGMGALIYIGSRSGEKLGKILVWLAHRLNMALWFIFRREYFHEIAAYEFGIEVAEGLSILHKNNEGIIVPFLLAINSKLIQVLILAVVFLSFNVPFSLGIIVAGFASAYLFLTVSPTPYGIGIVETMLPLTISSLGVSWEESVIVTLVYRAITFWLPLIFGGLAFRSLQSESTI